MKPITPIRHEQMLHYWLYLCLPDSTAAAMLHASAVHVAFFFSSVVPHDVQCVLQGMHVSV